MAKRVLVGAVAVVGVKVAALLVLRRWHLRWRATDAEVGATLPGDDLLPAADLTATRTIAIDAPAGEVWPWLAQMGQGRGGLYSYDFLENAVARCDMHSVGPPGSGMAADRGRRSGADPSPGAVGRRDRRRRPGIGPARRRAGRSATVALRLHLGVRP